MNIKHKLGIGVLAIATFASACTKNFADHNTNPEVSETLPPEYMITTSQKAMVDRDYEWYYDNYGSLMRWMQFTVSFPQGNVAGMFGAQNVNGYYGAFYTNIGRNLVEIEKIISKMPEADRGQYRNIIAIARIHKVFAGFRVADVNGSIPYTEALKARETANFTPVYESQEKLFATFDAELKGAADSLVKPVSGQVSYGTYDMFYTNAATATANYAKTANVLRLKIAMRMLKRNPAKVKQIVDDVLASTAGLYTGNAEEWKFISNTQFARGGNWGSQGNNASSAGRNILDFLRTHSDPRLRLFYKQNGMTKERFDYIKQYGGLPETAVFNPQRYIGIPVSPDAVTLAENVKLFGTKSYSLKLPGGKDETLIVDTLSQFQNRLFDLNGDGGANGQYTQPLLTYAEQCFIMAELSVRNIITQDAKTWYDKGVAASIMAYDAMGKIAGIVEYSAVATSEIDAYLQNTDIVFGGTDEQKLEKIGIQNFLNHFKSPWEAWGSWKRLGVPKQGGILPMERVMIGGTEGVIPRRWELPIPNTLNITNYNNAITEMQTGGEYGSPNQLTGRVWWDKQ